MKGRPQRRADRLSVLGEEDPLAGVANLFDVAMVFAVALLVSLVLYLRIPELMDRDQDLTMVTNPSAEEMEIITRRGRKITRHRVSRDRAKGEGIRLGTAYRLKTGDVIYVPDAVETETAPAEPSAAPEGTPP